tara:strand:- start:269 stop:580 length:312 start_codon:yes stop_codon:yes gene_type:complete
MKKFKILTSFYLILLLLNSCGTIKKGFTNPKKESGDEFLVEKKSPLVMPPEFNELPIPNNKNNNESLKENNIKNMISEKKLDKNNNISNEDLEGSILEKIKTD